MATEFPQLPKSGVVTGPEELETDPTLVHSDQAIGASNIDQMRAKYGPAREIDQEIHMRPRLLLAPISTILGLGCGIAAYMAIKGFNEELARLGPLVGSGLGFAVAVGAIIKNKFRAR